MELIEDLIENGWLKTPHIIDAFKNIKRADFLPENIKNLSEVNEALPIGFDQTISQPLVVAFMLELLEPKIGEKILDIGSGSGWTTALLAHCVSRREISKEIQNHSPSTDGLGPVLLKKGGGSKSRIQKGKVIALEIIPELVEFGRNNVAKYNFTEKGIAEFLCADGSRGYKKEAPYDKILCSAEAKNIPQAWKEQLKVGGKIVAPLGKAIWEIEKKEKDYVFKRYPGFVFVPLIETACR